MFLRQKLTKPVRAAPVDNCTAHPKVELTNIELEFLPPNTTSLIQPMDQGIIKNLKGHYRSKLATRLISELDSDSSLQMKDLAKNISLLDAIYLLDEAWQAVKETTISNCYRHSGFHKNNSSGDDFDPLQDIELPSNLSMEDLVLMVQVDESVETTGQYTVRN